MTGDVRSDVSGTDDADTLDVVQARGAVHQLQKLVLTRIHSHHH
jgi:hypothetical protein